jgi:hypothetical protein
MSLDDPTQLTAWPAHQRLINKTTAYAGAVDGLRGWPGFAL